MPNSASSSASDAPKPQGQVGAARLMSYTYIFAVIAIWNAVFSVDYSSGPSFDLIGPVVDSPGNGNNGSASPYTRVLIARTVSPSEIPNVIKDVMYVKSFYSGRHDEMKEEAYRHCPSLKAAGYAAQMDPYVNGTQHFPNHVLCNSDRAAADNNFLTVRSDFMLFARNEQYAHNLSQSIEQLSTGKHYLYDVQVDIRDVSHNPKKVWNWILHATDERLDGYDYIWFIDGDIFLKSLNWQAFWQQVKLMRPKIVQAGTVGKSPEIPGSTHSVLRYKPDSRVMAAESAIVEVQSPLLEARTWLEFRKHIVDDPEPMDLIEQGAEAVLDMAWCHLAKNNYEGKQDQGKMSAAVYQDWHPTLPSTEDAESSKGAKGRSCVVLYQTPIRHVSKMTIDVGGRFVTATKLLAMYFRGKRGVIGKGVFENPYEVWIAPKP